VSRDPWRCTDPFRCECGSLVYKAFSVSFGNTVRVVRRAHSGLLQCLALGVGVYGRTHIAARTDTEAPRLQMTSSSLPKLDAPGMT